MNCIPIKSSDLVLLRKIMPIICIIVPWEIYFYSTGWGIKFSFFYANFDMIYGTLFVNVVKQLSMLSYGGFGPSFRTISWFLGAFICVVVSINELFREDLLKTLSLHASGYLFLLCSIFNLLGSFAVWSSSFRAIPVAFFFFLFAAYIYFYNSQKGISNKH